MTTPAPEVRAQAATYRRAATALRESYQAHARARTEHDQAADTLTDARTAADAAHADRPRELRAAATRAATNNQEQAARAARDRLRLTESELERARVTERLEREILTTLRALLSAVPDAEL